MNNSHYLVLSISLIAWSFLHSALISTRFLSLIETRIGRGKRFYRMGYNIFSMATFLPIILFSILIKSEYIFIWTGYLQILRGIIIFFALYLFYAGARNYDGLQFLGIRQVRNNSNQKSLTGDGNLNMSGILKLIRHPWYAGTILILWVRNIDISALIVGIILTLYLIIGAYLEERKLVLEFGEQYRLYQKNVSMFFPFKFLKSKIFKRNPG